MFRIFHVGHSDYDAFEGKHCEFASILDPSFVPRMLIRRRGNFCVALHNERRYDMKGRGK